MFENVVCEILFISSQPQCVIQSWNTSDCDMLRSDCILQTIIHTLRWKGCCADRFIVTGNVTFNPSATVNLSAWWLFCFSVYHLNEMSRKLYFVSVNMFLLNKKMIKKNHVYMKMITEIYQINDFDEMCQFLHKKMCMSELGHYCFIHQGSFCVRAQSIKDNVTL